MRLWGCAGRSSTRCCLRPKRAMKRPRKDRAISQGKVASILLRSFHNRNRFDAASRRLFHRRPAAILLRLMKIHEYQARQILSDGGFPVPSAEVVRTPDEAAAAFKQFAQPMCVVKAQVYAG